MGILLDAGARQNPGYLAQVLVSQAGFGGRDISQGNVMKIDSSGTVRESPQANTGRKSKSSGTSRRVLIKSKPDSKPRFPVALIKEHFEVAARPITFAFFAPDAHEVFLAGTFNEWDSKGTPLVKGVSGRWEIEIPLKAGTYEYRLIVDGVWQEDPMAPRFAANPYGGLNSVIVVKD